MPNYLVDGQDLTAVADAIRAKGGTSDPLVFPTGFVSAVQAIPSGGGQIRKYTTSFTLENDDPAPVITHNLNTKKIAVLIAPADGSIVAAHAGYRPYTVLFINVVELLKNNQWTIDLTSYNSGRFPNPVVKTIGADSDYPRTATGQASPWTTQSNITYGTFYGEAQAGHIVGLNTYQYVGGGGVKMAAGTYIARIWALED